MDGVKAGQEVAGYRIEGFVARGGMAVVYRARDVHLGRLVALKLLAPELARHDGFRQRFLRESQLAASIDHPHIIPIYRAGRTDDLLYLAMRYVEGSDLKVLLARERPLSVDRAVQLFTQVAGALDAAHAHGLVHRDIKPGNVLVGSGGDDAPEHLYLTDFGLTKRTASLSGLTATGRFLGTVDYVAPEQIRGDAVDGRADIYALGCVLYEALTGHRPFERDVDAAVMYAHLHESPAPPSTLRADLPQQLDQVLADALAKQPEDRYDSCMQFMTDLRGAAGFTRPNVIVLPDTAAASLAPAPAVPPTRLRPASALPVPETSPQVWSPPPAAATVLRPLPEQSTRSPATQASTRPATLPAKISAAPAAGRQRILDRVRRSPALTIAVVMLVLLSGVAAAVLWPAGPAEAQDLQLPFPLEQYTEKNLEVSRTWTLSGEGDHVRGELLLVAREAGTVTYDEVLPKSLVDDAAEVTFDPQPDRVIRADPVVQFRSAGEADRRMVITYDIDVPAGPSTMERLQAWALAQQADAKRYLKETKQERPLTLRQLILPPTLELQVGDEPTPLNVTGTDNHGNPAGAALLGQPAFTVNPPGIVSVDVRGLVRPLADGGATITAYLGALSARTAVVVDPATGPPTARLVRNPDGTFTAAPIAPTPGSEGSTSAEPTDPGSSPTATGSPSAPISSSPPESDSPTPPVCDSGAPTDVAVDGQPGPFTVGDTVTVTWGVTVQAGCPQPTFRVEPFDVPSDDLSEAVTLLEAGQITVTVVAIYPGDVEVESSSSAQLTVEAECTPVPVTDVAVNTQMGQATATTEQDVEVTWTPPGAEDYTFRVNGEYASEDDVSGSYANLGKFPEGAYTVTVTTMCPDGSSETSDSTVALTVEAAATPSPSPSEPPAAATRAGAPGLAP